MFARIAVLIVAVAGAHAGIIGSYGAVAAQAYGAAIASPIGLGLGYESVLASPVSKSIVSAPIAAPAYGLGYRTVLSAPLAKIGAAPIVSSYRSIW